jgi:hypothetical protein
VEIEEARRNPELDLKPWTAYTLGLKSRELRLFQLSFDCCPDPDTDVLDGAPIILHELRTARSLLGEVLPGDVALRLDRLFDELRAHHDEVQREWSKNDIPGCPSPEPSDRGRQAWIQLVRLLDRALDSNSPLVPWYGLGAVMGRWGLDHHYTSRTVDPVDFLTVSQAVRALPVNDRTCCSGLERLSRSTESPEGHDGESLRRKFLRDNRDLLTRSFLETITSRSNFAAIMDRIAVEIMQSLLSRQRVPRPRWDREAGLLHYRGREARRVRPENVARNITRVLDAFEEDGWLSRIDNPVNNIPTATHDFIRQLNRGLVGIRFRGDGTGEGIEWYECTS